MLPINIDCPARRELDKTLVRQLATCPWVHEHHNVVITGMTGTGKTSLACVLAQQRPCRNGHRALYRRVPRLCEELTLAHADGKYIRLLARFARADVLVLDDWRRGGLRDQDRRDLVEILEDRTGPRATVVTSQLPLTKWHDYLADPPTADAQRPRRHESRSFAHAARPLTCRELRRTPRS